MRSSQAPLVNFQAHVLRWIRMMTCAWVFFWSQQRQMLEARGRLRLWVASRYASASPLTIPPAIRLLQVHRHLRRTAKLVRGWPTCITYVYPHFTRALQNVILLNCQSSFEIGVCVCTWFVWICTSLFSIYKHLFIYTHVYVRVYICKYMSVIIIMYIDMYTCVCVCVRACVCECVCVFTIWIYVHVHV